MGQLGGQTAAAYKEQMCFCWFVLPACPVDRTSRSPQTSSSTGHHEAESSAWLRSKLSRLSDAASTPSAHPQFDFICLKLGRLSSDDSRGAPMPAASSATKVYLDTSHARVHSHLFVEPKVPLTGFRIYLPATARHHPARAHTRPRTTAFYTRPRLPSAGSRASITPTP